MTWLTGRGLVHEVSDDRPEQLAYTCGDTERQCSPERHAQCRAQNVGTACLGANGSQQSEKGERRGRDDRDEQVDGETTTISKGMAAPTENMMADVSAACTGRALVISEIPSSSRA